MKKKTIKILLVMIMLIVAFTVTVNAATSGKDPTGYTGGGASVDRIEGLGNKIIQIVSVIGSIASVIVSVVLGIKYMMGKKKKKAEYKKTLLPYIIGAAFVFAASTLASVIYNFASSTLVS